MGDSDVFGVKDPKSGKTGFCSILGEAGTYLGLAIYLGEEGLGCLDKMFTMGSKAFDDEDILYEQDNINLLFGARNEVLPRELEAMKRLGLKYRGSQAWPVFRRYLPGYFPWYLTDDEMEFAALVLEQVIAVSEAYRHSPEKAGPFPDGRFLVQTCENGKWSGIRVKCHPAQPRSIYLSPTPIPDDLFEKVDSPPLPRCGAWEIDVFYAAPYVNEEKGERPYFPLVMAIMDCDTVMVVSAEMAGRDSGAEVCRRKFIEVLASLPIWPMMIRYRRDSIRDLLSPIAEHFGMSMVKCKKLPQIEDMRKHMRQAFTR
jgi:hypothetical protein